jgi:hypothetical protein
VTRSERKPTRLRVGPSDSPAHRSTVDGWLHPPTLNLPTTVQRGTQDGENVAVGLGSARWTNGYHTVPARASTRPARAIKKQPCAGLGRAASGGGASGRWPGPRPGEQPGTTVAGSGYGPQGRTHQTPSGAKPASRKLEYPHGELCHRVWHHRDAHRAWNPTALAVGGGQIPPVRS